VLLSPTDLGAGLIPAIIFVTNGARGMNLEACLHQLYGVDLKIDQFNDVICVLMDFKA
jgi:hypothetical protein